MRNKLNIIIQNIFLFILTIGFHTNVIAQVNDKNNQDAQTSLQNEVYNGNRQIVISFLEDHSDDTSVKDQSGWNLLHIATYREHEDIAGDIVENNPHIINDVDDKGQTALYIAVYKNNYNIAKLLIDHGADTNISRNGDWLPLHLAAYQGNIDLVTLLISKTSDVYQKTSVGWNALHLALSSENKNLISLLIQHIDINSKGRYGWTPLHLAYYIGNTDLISFLIEQGANTNTEDENGQIPSQMTSYYAPYTEQNNIFTSPHHQLRLFSSYLITTPSKPREEKYLRETLQFNRKEINTLKTKTPQAFAKFTHYKLSSAITYLKTRFHFNKKEIKELIIQNPHAFADFTQHKINFTMNELEKSLHLTGKEAKTLIENNFLALVHTRAPQIRRIISFMRSHRSREEIKERLIQGPQTLSEKTVLTLRQVMPLIDAHIGVDADRGTNENTTWVPLHWLLFAENIEQILPFIQNHEQYTSHLKAGYDSIHIPLHWELYEYRQHISALFKGEEICVRVLTN